MASGVADGFPKVRVQKIELGYFPIRLSFRAIYIMAQICSLITQNLFFSLRTDDVFRDDESHGVMMF